MNSLMNSYWAYWEFWFCC